MQQKQNDFIGFYTGDCLLPSAYWVLLSAYCLLNRDLIWIGIYF
jgi:hypothetical protein